MCLRPLTPAESQHRVAEAKQLRQRVEDGKGAEREAGLQGIVQFVDAVGQAAEPFVVPLVPAILKALADKVSRNIFVAMFVSIFRFLQPSHPCINPRDRRYSTIIVVSSFFPVYLQILNKNQNFLYNALLEPVLISTSKLPPFYRMPGSAPLLRLPVTPSLPSSTLLPLKSSFQLSWR